MKLNTLFLITGIIALFFGIISLFFPTVMYANFGITVDAGHIYISQLFGGANIAFALLLWFARKSKDTKGVVVAMFAFHFIGFIIALLGRLNNLTSSSGWVGVGLFLILSIGYAYFLFKK